mmetsp:Transcript_20072/g.37315  ORF Transcript_20072/g.37315 Transcript_20072/m.37315 type:complete len:95 (+) Transcript_20072:2317-2601(+)
MLLARPREAPRAKEEAAQEETEQNKRSTRWGVENGTWPLPTARSSRLARTPRDEEGSIHPPGSRRRRTSALKAWVLAVSLSSTGGQKFGNYESM